MQSGHTRNFIYSYIGVNFVQSYVLCPLLEPSFIYNYIPCVPSYYLWFLVVVQLSVVISFSLNYLG